MDPDFVAHMIRLGLIAVVVEILLGPRWFRFTPSLWTVRFAGEPGAVKELTEQALEHRVNEPSIWRRLDFDRLSDHEIAFDESHSRWTMRWGCALGGLIRQDGATGVVSVSSKTTWSVPLLAALLAVQALMRGEWPGVVAGCVAAGVVLTMRSARFDEVTRALRVMACRKEA